MKKLMLTCVILILMVCVSCTSNVSKESINDEVMQDEFGMQLESEHFIFYSLNSDKESVDIYKDELEKVYTKLSNKLQYDLDKKTIVNVYKDTETYHLEVFNDPNLEKWRVGNADGNSLNIVSLDGAGDVHDRESLRKTIVHEFVHVITIKKNPNFLKAPLWLSEGIATYESGQLQKEYIIRKMKEDKVPSIYAMETSKFAMYGGYQFSYTLIEYIDNEFGYETIIKLIEQPRKVREILNMSPSEMEKGWKEYLANNYK